MSTRMQSVLLFVLVLVFVVALGVANRSYPTPAVEAASVPAVVHGHGPVEHHSLAVAQPQTRSFLVVIGECGADDATGDLTVELDSENDKWCDYAPAATVVPVVVVEKDDDDTSTTIEPTTSDVPETPAIVPPVVEPPVVEPPVVEPPTTEPTTPDDKKDHCDNGAGNGDDCTPGNSSGSNQGQGQQTGDQTNQGENGNNKIKSDGFMLCILWLIVCKGHYRRIMLAEAPAVWAARIAGEAEGNTYKVELAK